MGDNSIFFIVFTTSKEILCQALKANAFHRNTYIIVSSSNSNNSIGCVALNFKQCIDLYPVMTLVFTQQYKWLMVPCCSMHDYNISYDSSSLSISCNNSNGCVSLQFENIPGKLCISHLLDFLSYILLLTQ